MTNELIAAGVSQAEIGRIIGLSQPVVHEIASGKRVRDLQWTHGNLLIALHRQRCQRLATPS